MILDSALTWEPQVRSVVGKVKSILYRLRRMSGFTDAALRAKLVSTLIFPQFDYCAATYVDLPGTLDSKLQIALNCCVRFVYGIGTRTHITPYRLELGWLTTRDRRLFLSSRLLHKILLTSTPPYLSSLLSFQIRSRPSRIFGPQLNIPFSTSLQYTRSFIPHTSNFWNSLPPDLRLADSSPVFKSHLKSLLLQA